MPSFRKRYIGFLLVGLYLGTVLPMNQAQNPVRAYVIRSDDFSAEGVPATNEDTINFDEVLQTCNSSFSIPMDYLVEFNNTGELPNTVDKTGPCFIRCFLEETGFIDNWQLNAEKIRKYMWPATGDSLDVCQDEEKNHTNPCLRTYAIAKCLMTRALVDARNKPMV